MAEKIKIRRLKKRDRPRSNSHQSNQKINPDAGETVKPHGQYDVQEYLQLEIWPIQDHAVTNSTPWDEKYIVTGTNKKDLRSPCPVRLQILAGTEREEAVAMVEDAVVELEYGFGSWFEKKKI